MISYPMDKSKIHLIEVKNKKFVLDVNSAIFFEIDDLVSDLLHKMCSLPSEELIIEALSKEYPRAEVIINLKELLKLIDQDSLFSSSRFGTFKKNPDAPLSMICLNIAHDCNLRCAYCFANREGYTHDKRLMTKETAARAIDFLIDGSRSQRDLEVSFFGGEPLMNVPILQHTVEYAKEQGRKQGKSIKFHITTNGTLLKPELIRFLKRNDFSIIFSLDGPKEVQDNMRCFPNGKGSYDVVLKNLQNLLKESKKFRSLTVRSTFTRKNLAIEDLMMHLADIGCDHISVEPAYCGIDGLDIQGEDLDELLSHYDILADRYLDELIGGRYFTFFHLKQMMDHGHRKNLKLTQCGASVGYVAVSADGKTYPCHKFVGQEEYQIGDIYNGIKNAEIRNTFAAANVRNKRKCMKCWARYICGGACHYLAIQYNNNILDPYDLECKMTKRRIELGIYLYTTLKSKNPAMYNSLYLRDS